MSSLLSHFENLAVPKPASNHASRPTTQRTLQQSDLLEVQRDQSQGRSSLDLPRRDHAFPSPIRTQDNRPQRSLRSPLPPVSRSTTPNNISRQRPISMQSPSPPIDLPSVTIDSPVSAPLLSHLNVPDRGMETLAKTATPRVGAGRHMSQTPPPRDLRASTRSPTPATDLLTGSMPRGMDLLTSSRLSREFPGTSQDKNSTSITLPPPVNRTEKPRFPSISLKVRDNTHAQTLSLPTAALPPIERVSPFSTPPSSEGSPTTEDVSPPFRSPQDGQFQPPPVHHSIAKCRREQSSASSRMTASHDPRLQGFGSGTRGPNGPADRRPGLPPRRGNSDFAPKVLGTFDAASSPATKPVDPIGRSLPPPERSIPSHIKQTLKDPESLVSAEQMIRPRSIEPPVSLPIQQQHNPPRDDITKPRDPVMDGNSYVSTDYPDSSQTNRRRPCFKVGPYEIHTKYDTRLFDICGRYVCTTGYLTRVWDISSGNQLMTMTHEETVKITSLAFKPGGKVEDEGKRLWLGTNSGEIQEVDIRAQNVVYTKNNAHTRREVIRIYRRQNEMWTLDDEGKLHVWPPDQDGLPNLQHNHTSFKVPRGHSFSLIISEQLWYATGKEIRIFQPSARSDKTFQILKRPLNQPGVGDVTSGAVISGQLDRAYFGHTDGKVTIYSTKDYTCLGIVNVSVYKISSLAGAGNYLWAGYNTGMIYVYDTESNPWTVKKDWHAHENPVASIIVDRSSIWKLGRLQVASLGNDNTIRIWDGMLEDDWLGAITWQVCSCGIWLTK